MENTLVDGVCFSGTALNSTTTTTGGDCCTACKQSTACDLWTYNPVTQACTLRVATGWSDQTGGCTSGYLNRDAMPDDVATYPGTKSFTGQTLNVTTGATTLEACATLCDTTPTCGYFTWSGPPGSNKPFNSNGANCWLVDSAATPSATTDKGGYWGVSECLPEPETLFFVN